MYQYYSSSEIGLSGFCVLYSFIASCCPFKVSTIDTIIGFIRSGEENRVHYFIDTEKLKGQKKRT